MNKVLSIAGSDCSGGAGIQADIKTITAHKMYAMSVITALTAQNTTGVYGVFEADPDFVGQQLDCVFTDIFPDAVKVGMVSSAGIIGVIADKLKEYQAKNIVLDPVMFSTSGHALLSPDSMDALKKKLIPAADIITPNIPEAESLCGFSIENKEQMVMAAEAIHRLFDGYVLVKGGHFGDCADDLLYGPCGALWFSGERVNTKNTHGTGCTLSSAVACGLARGLSMEQSVRNAKAYVTGALKSHLALGKGCGPLDHCFGL